MGLALTPTYSISYPISSFKNFMSILSSMITNGCAFDVSHHQSQKDGAASHPSSSSLTFLCRSFGGVGSRCFRHNLLLMKGTFHCLEFAFTYPSMVLWWLLGILICSPQSGMQAGNAQLHVWPPGCLPFLPWYWLLNIGKLTRVMYWSSSCTNCNFADCPGQANFVEVGLFADIKAHGKEGKKRRKEVAQFAQENPHLAAPPSKRRRPTYEVEQLLCKYVRSLLLSALVYDTLALSHVSFNITCLEHLKFYRANRIEPKGCLVWPSIMLCTWLPPLNPTPS